MLWRVVRSKPCALQGPTLPHWPCIWVADNALQFDVSRPLAAPICTCDQLPSFAVRPSCTPSTFTCASPAKSLQIPATVARGLNDECFAIQFCNSVKLVCMRAGTHDSMPEEKTLLWSLLSFQSEWTARCALNHALHDTLRLAHSLLYHASAGGD